MKDTSPFEVIPWIEIGVMGFNHFSFPTSSRVPRMCTSVFTVQNQASLNDHYP
jgi:hypothetical protein